MIPLFVFAQGEKVITHTVGPKESLSSIGRLYNINGRELANYNKIDYEKGLSIGQVLKIPVKNNQAENSQPLPVKTEPQVKKITVNRQQGTPVYHVVNKKETLYAISKKYSGITIADIKKWNNLTSDALSEGSKLIVGYTEETNEVVKPETKITEVVKPETPVVNAPAPEVVKPKEKAPDAEVPKQVNKTTTVPEVSKTPVNFNGGFFKKYYEEQVNDKQLVTETGVAGVFKSNSGWEDGKYYCLHNTAAPGTIIKITSKQTGKSVYAKVLDLIPDIKQNDGLLIRISNAATGVLGISDNKLDCTINYSK